MAYIPDTTDSDMPITGKFSTCVITEIRPTSMPGQGEILRCLAAVTEEAEEKALQSMADDKEERQQGELPSAEDQTERTLSGLSQLGKLYNRLLARIQEVGLQQIFGSEEDSRWARLEHVLVFSRTKVDSGE